MRPGRGHHFWQRPVAAAVRQELQRHLPGTAAAPFKVGKLPQAAVWLARTPQGLHVGVWRVLCLAALLAMDSVRPAPHGGVAVRSAAQCSSRCSPSSGPLVPACPSCLSCGSRPFLVHASGLCMPCSVPASWLPALAGGHPYSCWRAPVGPKLVVFWACRAFFGLLFISVMTTFCRPQSQRMHSLLVITSSGL